MQLLAQKTDYYVFRHKMNRKSDHKTMEASPAQNQPTMLLRVQHNKYLK